MMMMMMMMEVKKVVVAVEEGDKTNNYYHLEQIQRMLIDGTVYDYHIVMVIASVIVMIIVNVYKNLDL